MTIKLDAKRLLGYAEKQIATNQASMLAGAKVGELKRAGAKVGAPKRSAAKVGAVKRSGASVGIVKKRTG